MTIDLTEAALPRISDDVGKPSYDRSSLTHGIVHIGVGNFHRAHQAIYLDTLFGLGIDHDWAIIGAGVRPADVDMRADLATQDWLTTVVELEPAGLTARICGSMIGYVEPSSTNLIEALTSPEVRIVSLTVTEGGYYVDATTGGFATGHPDIVADIASPDTPKTVFGIIVAALAKRREQGTPAFTIMSCDNLPGNGHIAQNAVVGLASEVSADLGKWIDDNASFPNGMVDCIAPAAGDRERALVADTFGIKDARPVTCEPFRQWVLEDKFVAGRPALEKVGVQFVADVAPYELMKLRILNASHAVIAYPAALLGIHMVHDAMADQHVRAFLQTIAQNELIPSVQPIPGVDFGEYFANVERRFSNAAVADTIPRLCQDGSNRQPKFILPVTAERLAAGRPVPGTALEVALWCRYCAGTDEEGREIALDDPIAKDLRESALRARANPAAFLEIASVFGPLGQDAEFQRTFAAALNSLWEHGVRKTITAYVEEAKASCS